jgi:D-alanine-D-alanine ligase-like ATP-grasp enzyme
MPNDDAALRAAALVARAGRRGRTLAVRLDTAALVGPARLARQRRARRARGVPGAAARDAVYARVWRDGAAPLGVDFEDLGGGFYAVRNGAAEVRLFQQVTPIDDPVTLRLALDKPRVHELVAAADVAVPEHVAFSADDPRPALELLERVGRIVVKPAAGTGGGEGVTAGIERPEDLVRAQLRAGRFDDELLAERQAPGLVHRLLLLDDTLLDVIADRPPHVVGDGRCTIEELVGAENDRRLRARGEAGLELLDLDADAVLTLRAAGLTLGDVPAAGQEVAVKSVTNDHRVEDSWTYRGEIHADVLDQARAAVRAVGLRLAGVDVVAPAIDRPLRETGGVVLEVNGSPGIHRHSLVADRAQATNVAAAILRALLH